MNHSLWTLPGSKIVEFPNQFHRRLLYRGPFRVPNHDFRHQIHTHEAIH